MSDYPEGPTYSLGCLDPTLSVTDNGISLHDDYFASYASYGECPYDFEAEVDTDVRNGRDAIPMALAGEVTITETVTVGCSVDCDGAPNTEKMTLTDSGQTVVLYENGTWDGVDSFSTTVDVTKFFTNPLDRTDLPTLGYDLTRNTALSDLLDDGCVHDAYPGLDGVYDTCDAGEYVVQPDPDTCRGL